MPEKQEDISLAKAKAFFSRAEEVAATDNFDYAIDMYIEGLKRAPDELELGHKPLRHNALIRQAKGGKKPSIMEKMKRSRGKDPIEGMLNAEFLLAKDPDNLSYAEQMLKNAVAAKQNKTALWIADLIYEANRASEKPSFQTFMLLKESYVSLEEYARAVNACGYASQLKPDDAGLADELRNLSASLVVQKGKYDKDSDFRGSIKDKAAQDKLQAQQATIKTADFRKQAVVEARQKAAANPTQQNIMKLTEMLAEMHTDENDAEAVKLLEKYYASTKDFAYKKRSGEILMKTLRRHVRKAKLAVEANPTDAASKELLKKASKELFLAELEHYRLSIENYPTDLGLKDECGVRLMRNQKYDQAIPFLQDARKEPRNRVAAMGKIGLCFFMKGWFTDAIDTFKEAIDSYEIKDNDTAKDLRYNLARTYEQQGDSAAAMDIYRKLAQLDYGYKDVRARIDRLRNGAAG